MKITDLNPCPFCGGAADFCDTGVFWVRCNECGADGQAGDTMEEAVSLWNRRAALAVQTQQGVEGLGWHKPVQRNSLSRAENNLGVYRVWTHFEANGRWFWSLDGYEKVSGECASEEEAKAAAQSDYEQRIRSALVDVPAVESEPVAWQWEEDLINSGRYTLMWDDESPGEHPGIRNVTPLYAHPPRSLSNEGSELDRFRSALLAIAHTFTEDSHGGTKSLPASEYQDMARAALSTRKGSAGDGAATGTSGGDHG